MRKNEITLGKYTDGKGNIREVLDFGPQYVLYRTQQEQDNLRYKLLAKKRGPHAVGTCHNSTRQSFANWAKEVVV